MENEPFYMKKLREDEAKENPKLLVDTEKLAKAAGAIKNINYKPFTDDEKRAALAKKLLEVYKSVGHVEKRGRNDFHKYDYVMESDAAEKVREAMVKAGLVLIPTVKERHAHDLKGQGDKITPIHSVMMTYRLIDTETGFVEIFDMTGDGMDTGDKGIYKAITGCQKYAYLKLSLASAGDDDPEKDFGPDSASRAKGKAKETPSSASPKAGSAAPATTSDLITGNIIALQGATGPNKPCTITMKANNADAPTVLKFFADKLPAGISFSTLVEAMNLKIPAKYSYKQDQYGLKLAHIEFDPAAGDLDGEAKHARV